jgi:polyisoprenoid-binding protein YceI
MKKLVMITAVAIGMIAAVEKTQAQSHKLNVNESTLKWHAKKVTGEHYGVVSIQSGQIITQGNKLTGGTVVVDMSTIDVTDLEGEWKDKLVGHLKSDDFFATANFTTAKLKLKSATPISGAKAGENNYTIVADLTIKDIAHEVTFPAMVVINKGKVITNAEFNIDRTKYDIRYGSKSFFAEIGDKAINDDFNIKVRIVAYQ